MKLIHYGTSGMIRVNENEYPFRDFLKLDTGYFTPHGFHTRVYERGVRHYVTDGYNTVSLPLVDEYCDRICNREGELIRLLQRLKLEKD